MRLALVAVGWTAAGAPVHAVSDAGCKAINRGALNVELGEAASTMRQVALKAGDTVTFSFEAAPGPFGSLMLREGAGAPRSLLVGPTGTSVSFVAAKAGPFGFEFSKEGSEAAAFTASCVPAGSATRERTATAKPSTTGRTARLTESLTKAEDLEAAEFAGFSLDVANPKPADSAVVPRVEDVRPPAATAPRHAGGIDMKLQWRGERYQVGADGLETDHTASGVDAALNYKLLPKIMVGALAQVDQPAETLIGPPLSLSDQGWLAGPAANVKLASGLTLDARAAWGSAETGADELSARTTSTERRLVSARLANTQSFGPWRFTPSISVNHFYETPTSAAEPAPEITAPSVAGSGRVDVAPEFAYRIDLDKSMFIEPKAVIGSFWGIESLSKLAPGASGNNDMRLKAEAGVTIGASDGAKLQAAGGVEEGEPGADDVWSGRLQLSVPMK
jgi:hypothetical protein